MSSLFEERLLNLITSDVPIFSPEKYAATDNSLSSSTTQPSSVQPASNTFKKYGKIGLVIVILSALLVILVVFIIRKNNKNDKKKDHPRSAPSRSTEFRAASSDDDDDFHESEEFSEEKKQVSPKQSAKQPKKKPQRVSQHITEDRHPPRADLIESSTARLSSINSGDDTYPTANRPNTYPRKKPVFITDDDSETDEACENIKKGESKILSQASAQQDEFFTPLV